MQSNRRFERLPYFTRVELFAEDGSSIVAKTVDISLGGTAIMSPKGMALGQRVSVKFVFREGTQGDAAESVAGTILSVRSDPDGTLLGLEFAEPLNRDRNPLLVKRVERLYRPTNEPEQAPERGAAAPAGFAATGQLSPFDEWVTAHARIASKPRKRSNSDDTTTFFQQLSTLVSSGTPLLQSLKLCAEQSQSIMMRGVLAEIAGKVASGSTFYAAAASYTNLFEHHWIEVIRVGEVTGKMGQVLLELNRQIRESRATRKKVMGALMYPMILIFVAITAVTVMLWLVVPTFAAMFKDMGAQLPAITQFVVDASAFIVAYGAYGVAGMVALAFGVRRYARTESGRSLFGGVGIVMPMVGELLVQMAMYRFSSNISLLLKSGVPMLETLTTLRGIFQTSPLYRNALARVHGRVSSGKPLAASLDETGLFPSMLTNMVRTGEESGQLAAVMEQIAPYYKEKMENLITKVTKMLEPIIIMGMGTTIAGLMLSIYMPMFEMAGKVN